MTPNLQWTDPSLINTVGHATGALLFCVVTVLLLSDWRYRSLRHTGLALVASILAFCWNVGSLIALAAPDAGYAPVVGLFSFSMLTLLPANLLQVTVQGRHPALVAAGYAISIIACCLHASQIIVQDDSPHQSGLVIVALGFPLLALLSLLLDFSKQRSVRHSDWLSFISLLVFTTSFLHFGYRHSESPWAAEVTWHHIGIPVALIVLLRDYRFLLLDTFVRFAVNFGLAAIYVSGTLAIAWRVSQANWISGFAVGVALVGACLALITFAYGRALIQAWLNRVIFRRREVQSCDAAITELGRMAASEEELLLGAEQLVAQYLRATHCVISPDPETHQPDFPPETQIPMRLSSGQTMRLALGPRLGGRRYWSDDLNDLRHLSAAIVEQLERFRAEEMKRLVTQAELRALQAQINPHFLFNAFNTLYGVIDRQSHEARRLVLNLAELFRYFLQGSREQIPLSEEMRIVRAYLEIESLRLGSRLQTNLQVADETGPLLIPILSIQPLVENAVKHGVESKSDTCEVTVITRLTSDGLQVSVADSGAGFARSRTKPRAGTGIGLQNVQRRLALSYGPQAALKIESDEQRTIVSFLIPRVGPGADHIAASSLRLPVQI